MKQDLHYVQIVPLEYDLFPLTESENILVSERVMKFKNCWGGGGYEPKTVKAVAPVGRLQIHN